APTQAWTSQKRPAERTKGSGSADASGEAGAKPRRKRRSIRDFAAGVVASAQDMAFAATDQRPRQAQSDSSRSEGLGWRAGKIPSETAPTENKRPRYTLDELRKLDR